MYGDRQGQGLVQRDPAGKWWARYEPRRDVSGTWLKARHTVVVRFSKPIVRTKTFIFTYADGDFARALREAFAAGRTWALVQTDCVARAPVEKDGGVAE